MNGNSTVSMTPNGALLGAFTLGVSILGTGETTILRTIDLYNARGKSFRIYLRNQQADQPFKIRGYKVWYTYVEEFPG
jgi:hypothetical protein